MAETIDCQYLVVGAGVWGTSIALHLAELGATDVVLIDRYDVADGSSWAAAGFVGQIRHGTSDVQIVRYSADLYASYERDFPGSIGWGGEGSLRLSYTEERTAEFRTLVEQAGALGVECSVASPAETAELAPTLELSGLDSALWVPGDSSVVPEKLARAMAGNAQAGGVRFLAGVEAIGFRMDGDGIAALVTSDGEITARHYVVAAGVFTPELIGTAGVGLPLFGRQANYVVSNLIPQADLVPMPTLRIPDRKYYARVADSRIAVGATRAAPVYELPSRVPTGRRMHWNEITDLGGAVQDAEELMPAFAAAGVSHAVRAYESGTPDTRFIAGETFVPGLWVVAGGQGYGIAAAGGLGREVARALTGTPSEVDMTPFLPDRFGSQTLTLDDEWLDTVRHTHHDRYAIASVGGR